MTRRHHVFRRLFYLLLTTMLSAAFGAMRTAAADFGYPPPPGPYTNPAVQQWLAARTEPLLASARRERGTTAEAVAPGGTPGDPDISTQLISVRSDPWQAPRPWDGPTANVESRASDGSADAGSYAGKPLRWRNPGTAPVNRTGTPPKPYGPIPRQGLLDPLPAAPVASRWAVADLRGPESAAAEAAAGHRSTSELLALYLDYDLETMTADADPQGRAPAFTPRAHSQARAPEPESQRYYYRPTGTTFQFRALETPPRQPQQTRNAGAGDWPAPGRVDGAW